MLPSATTYSVMTMDEDLECIIETAASAGHTEKPRTYDIELSEEQFQKIIDYAKKFKEISPECIKYLYLKQIHDSFAEEQCTHSIIAGLGTQVKELEESIKQIPSYQSQLAQIPQIHAFFKELSRIFDKYDSALTHKNAGRIEASARLEKDSYARLVTLLTPS